MCKAWVQIDMELARFRGVNCTLLDEFVCAVCHDVCLEPVQLPCQHLFCIKCISGAVSARSHQSGAAQCPVCRQSFHGEDVAVSRPIWNFLGKLQVACEFSINGCSAVHAVHDAEHHAGGCPFRPLKCRWCPQVHRTELITDHEATCDHRPVDCPRCHASVAHADLVAGAHSCEPREGDPTAPCSCRHRPLGCGWQGLQSEEADHLSACWSEQGKAVLHGLVGRIGLLEREKHEAATRGDALEARMQGEIEMKNEVILRMVAQSEMPAIPISVASRLPIGIWARKRR